MKAIIKAMILLPIFAFVSISTYIFLSPKPDLLNNLSYSRAITDENHQLLRFTLSLDEKYRLFTPIDAIAKPIILATLLQEDRHFYKHFGINPIALMKALWQTYIVHSRRMGASTISMQVARMRFNVHSKKIGGKIQQILYALILEHHYSKNEILEAYFNLAPYGNNIEGIGAASLIYFNKTAEKLNINEALTLATMPQNPSKRHAGSKELQKSADKLLERFKTHFPEIATIHSLPQPLSKIQALPFKAPHFTNAVLKKSDLKTGQIVTTLNLSLQNVIERVTHIYLQRKKAQGAYNAAVLLVDTRDMGVKAMLGSADFFNKTIHGQINGTDTKRSPGSTLKPFIYALALDEGLIHPLTVLKDVPQSFGSYNPENFDYDFMGPVTAQDALILSRNIPAITLAYQLKTMTLHNLLEKAEISHLLSESHYGLALVLGGAELSMQELTTLYAMLVNEGSFKPLRLTKETPLEVGKRLLSPEASFLVQDILEHSKRPNNHDTLKLPISWKTGTSSGFRDAWTLGSFGPYVLGVWIGNFDNTANPAFIGKNIASPLFFEIIEAIHQEIPIPKYSKEVNSKNIIKLSVCKASGLLPTRFCKTQEETWFIPGKSPIRTDTIFREVAINPENGLRTCHIDENTQFIIYEFWPSDLLKIFKKAGISRKTPPFFEPGCDTLSNQGIPPQITSPQTNVNYIIRAFAKGSTKIPLSAITDADVSTLYWFINNTLIAKTPREKPLLWDAKPGKYLIRVIDDHGLSDVRNIDVRVE